LADFNICWINFIIEKFAWKPILDAVNERRRNQNALLSAENAKKEMLDLQDNQRIASKIRA
jgi:F-type H+-transporting ATPase subunit b